MSLRTKVLLPLAFFCILMFGYLYGYWMPRSLDTLRIEYRKSIERHLDSVAVGLIPLLLAHQLDTVYENLDALRDKNGDWVSVELDDGNGKSLYPLGGVPTQSKVLPAGEVHVLERRLDFVGMNLGTLIVKVDFAPRLSPLEKEHRELAAILFAVIAAFVLSAWFVLERLVIGPVKVLSKASSELAQNRFEGPPLGKTGDDEVGQLVDRFSEMREAIQGYQAALKKSEVRYKQALDDLLEGCVILGFDWTYLYVNEAAAQSLKSKRESIIGRTLFRMYPGVERTKLFAHYESAMSQRTRERFEESYTMADGTTVWYTFSVEPVPEGIFVLSLDITERKQAEDENRRLNEELERRVAQRTALLEAANEELENLSYSMSHDMYIPLRAIDGFSKLLLEGHGQKLGDDGRRMLAVVRANARRMGSQIDGILDFLRVRKVSMSYGPIDIATLAHEALTELLAKTPARRLRLDAGVLPLAWGDRDLMRQVLMNLLSNAIKFSPADAEAVIALSGAAGDNEDTYAVKDNGVGFDMQYAGKLFRVFERVHPTGEYEGAGTGLAIVKRIIERHGGRVWAESKVSEGTTIHFTLPHRSEQH